MRCTLSVVQCLVILFSLQVSAPPAVSAQPFPAPPLSAKPLSAKMQQFHDHLQHLDGKISRSLQQARMRAATGGSPAAELAEEAERLRRHLRQLEAKVHSWTPAERQTALERLQALDLAMVNMEAAAKALHRDPDALAGSRWRVATVHDASVDAKDAPANDDCADATTATTGITIGDTSSATNDGSASCGDSSFAPDVWFKYTAPVDGRVFVNTFGSAFDTVLSVHSGCPSPDSQQIRCNDNQSGLQSALGFTAEAGTEYLIRVSGFAGASGPLQLDIGPGGTVSGIVTDAASGSPIDAVTVRFTPETGYSRIDATTDADGRYTITGVESDTYRAFIRDSAPYLPEVYDGLPCSGNCDPDIGTPIEVGANAVINNIDFALELGGSITGTVLDADTGEPISAARVEIWQDENRGSPLVYTLTDASGHYSVEGLLSGVYFAAVLTNKHMDELYDDHPCPEGPFFGCDLADGEVIQVTLGAATVGIDFALDRLGAISGIVTDASTDEPITFADVVIADDTGRFAGRSNTDGNGRYIVGGLPPGTYFAFTDVFRDYVDEIYDDISCDGSCDPTTGTPIAVPADVTAGIDFELDPLGEITGTVTEVVGGEPVSGYVSVLAWNASGDFEASGEAYGSAGDYRIRGLPPGTYFVTTDSEDYSLPSHRYLDELYDDIPCPSGAPAGCNPITGTAVVMNAGDSASGIDFALVEAGSISGAVTAEATGEPLSDVNIIVFDQTGDQVSSIRSEAGVYRAIALPTGSYFVGAFSQPWIDEIYDDRACDDAGCVPTFGTPVTVTLGVTTERIDFALAQDGGITGTVTDAETGGGLPLYQVELYDESGFRGSVSTNSSGGYQFFGLPAGSYFIRTDGFGYDPSPMYRDEVYDDLPCEIDCDVTLGTPVEVAAEGVITGIDLALDLLGSISGTVTSSTTGNPIQDASVAIYDAAGSFIASERSDATGAFTIHALTGSVFALASGFRYVNDIYPGLPCSYPCDVTTGTPIAVNFGETTKGIDFTLDRPGSISGFVTNAATGNPADGIEIEVWDGSGNSIDRTSTNEAGEYLAEGLVSGTYFVTARTDPFLGALYPDLPCPSDTCDPTTGTPVPVSHGGVTPGIDFALTLAGVISGQTIDADTGRDLSLYLTLWDADGDLVQSTHSFRRYAFSGLSAGTYFISARDFDDHHDQLYDHVPCPGGPPLGCDPTSGTPVLVTDNSYQRIDFALTRRCSASDAVLCLNGRRFQVEVAWEDFDNNAGLGNSFGLTDDSGYFWFFGEDNVEVIVKVLDACGLPGFNNFWVFAGGLTNVAAELTVTDTFSGEAKTYENPLGAPFQPIQDTGAFETCNGRPPTPQDLVGEAYADFERELAALNAAGPTQIPEKTCGGESGLCLAEDRFRVEARWRTQEGEAGEARPVQLTDATGYFWFFGPDNVEVIVKVLDACNLEGFRNFWFFAAGLTDVEVILTVTDTESGEVQEYVNPLGAKFQPIQDTGSFRTCP